MPTGFGTIRAKIKAKLTTVSELAFVYDFHRAELEGYPAATFDVSDSSNDFLTNQDNLRTYTFLIVLYQETTIKGLDEATNLLDTLADKVVDTFEQDETLGGVVNWCNPLTGPRVAFETPQGLVITQQLSLKCNIAVQV